MSASHTLVGSIEQMRIKAIEKFWRSVQRGAEHECWPWLGDFFHDGYGRFNAFRIAFRAHRFSLEISGVDVPPDARVLVRHKCHNPACVNPSHLVLGTQFDNMRDMSESGRAARGDRHGSKTHPEALRRGDDHPLVRVTTEKLARFLVPVLAGRMTATRAAKESPVSRATLRKILRGERRPEVMVRARELLAQGVTS